MRTWRYNVQDEGTRDVTDAEIIATYYPEWSSAMLEAYRTNPEVLSMITQANCIERWVAIHWAWEVKE